MVGGSVSRFSRSKDDALNSLNAWAAAGELISTPTCIITQDDQPAGDQMSTSPSSVGKVCHLLLSHPANVSLYGHALHSLLNPLIRRSQRHRDTAVLEGHYGVVLVLRCCGCMYYDVRFDLRWPPARLTVRQLSISLNLNKWHLDVHYDSRKVLRCYDVWPDMIFKIDWTLFILFININVIWICTTILDRHYDVTIVLRRLTWYDLQGRSEVIYPVYQLMSFGCALRY